MIKSLVDKDKFQKNILIAILKKIIKIFTKPKADDFKKRW
jgi:hypothetical protein